MTSDHEDEVSAFRPREVSAGSGEPNADPSQELQRKDTSTQTEASIIELFKSFVTKDWVSAAAGPRLPIRPDFVKGDVVLVSSDDVGFAFSLNVLARHSPVFRGLAELPRASDSCSVLPVSMASAATLDVLLRRLDPARALLPVPSVQVLEELVAVVDAFDFPTSIIKAAVYRSELNVGIKYAFAAVFDPSLERQWALECLGTLNYDRCSQWDRHPEAHETLRTLFVKWRKARVTYLRMFIDEAVNGYDGFGKRCRRRSQPCAAFEQFQGDWAAVKACVGAAVSEASMDAPKTGKEVIGPLCQILVPCPTCAQRLGAHAKRIWSNLIGNGSWRH